MEITVVWESILLERTPRSTFYGTQTFRTIVLLF